MLATSSILEGGRIAVSATNCAANPVVKITDALSRAAGVDNPPPNRCIAPENPKKSMRTIAIGTSYRRSK